MTNCEPSPAQAQPKSERDRLLKKQFAEDAAIKTHLSRAQKPREPSSAACTWTGSTRSARPRSKISDSAWVDQIHADSAILHGGNGLSH